MRFNGSGLIHFGYPVTKPIGNTVSRRRLMPDRKGVVMLVSPFGSRAGAPRGGAQAAVQSAFLLFNQARGFRSTRTAPWAGVAAIVAHLTRYTTFHISTIMEIWKQIRSSLRLQRSRTNPGSRCFVRSSRPGRKACRPGKSPRCWTCRRRRCRSI